MKTKWMKRALLLVGIAALTGAVTYAQTDVALSLYGAFSGSTTGDNSIKQSPANAAGGLLELRHIHNPLVGYEATYSFNRANQTYALNGLYCPAGACQISSTTVPANAHEVTADWVASLKIGNLRPFALAGGGILVDVPAGGQKIVFNEPVAVEPTTSTATKPVFVYGAGADWGLLPHIGLRLQYRGNLYKAPSLTNIFDSTGALVHTAEPMIGIYLRL